MKISIVICTHNRARLLNRAIESLIPQIYSEMQVEILIIDNGSSDATDEIVNAYREKTSKVNYFFEPVIGLSHARNRGWREARGEYIAYLDDDAITSPDWLKVAFEIIDTICPDSFGGPYYPYYTTTKPEWYKDEYASNVIDQNPRQLCDDEFLTGGNMFIKRELVEKIGGFSNKLGMNGLKMAYGEETDFFKNLRIHKPDSVIFYDPRLWIRHHVRAEKMILRNVPRQAYLRGIYSHKALLQANCVLASTKSRSRAFHLWKTIKAIVRVLFLTVSSIILFITRFVSFNKSKYPFFQNYIYENLRDYFNSLGFWCEAIRYNINMAINR